MTVRSARLFGPLEFVQGGPTITYVVPAGRTAVLRTLLLECDGVNGTEVRLRLGIAGLYFWRGQVAGSTTVVLPYMVFNPGDVIRFSSHTTGSSPTHATGFGSLLLGAPT